MPYTLNTFGSLQTQLANRLNDPTSTFYPVGELQVHIWNALRFWNALTGDNRVWFNLPISSPFPVWYDFHTLANSPRLAVVTDANIYSWLQYALLEPQSGVPLTLGTAQFTVADFVNAVQRVRDEYLFRTNCTMTVRPVVPTPNVARVLLPETVIEVRRGYWLAGVGGQANPIFKADERQAAGYASSMPFTPGNPYTFSAGIQPPLTVEFYAPPSGPGTVEFLTNEAQAVLSATVATTLFIPSDLAPAIFWGALADLLSKSTEATDKKRADYARMRFEQFIQLATIYPFIQAARASGPGSGMLYVDAVETMDAYMPSWRTSTANPYIAGVSGQNLLAYPANSAAQISLLVTANAKLPVLSTDAVQLGDEVLDVILDYAQHVASFKMGWYEFALTMPLLQNILVMAKKRNTKLLALSAYKSEIYGASQRENVEVPNEREDESEQAEVVQ